MYYIIQNILCNFYQEGTLAVVDQEYKKRLVMQIFIYKNNSNIAIGFNNRSEKTNYRNSR